jgi:hypothetical protein
LYPLPEKLGNLLKKGLTTKSDNVHPSLLDDVTTESLMKLMKFGLWVNYQIRMKKSHTIEEVLRKELKLYKNELKTNDNITVITTSLL